MSYPEQGLITV